MTPPQARTAVHVDRDALLSALKDLTGAYIRLARTAGMSEEVIDVCVMSHLSLINRVSISKEIEAANVKEVA